jgi:uncharacterized protein (TIGR02246 family)
MIDMARWWFLIIALLVWIAACEQQEAEEAGTAEETPAVDAAAVEEHIRSMDARFEQGMSAGDAEGLVTLYAPDAMVLAPGMPLAQGTDAVRSVWQQMFAAGPPTGVSLDTQKVVVSESGDMAYQVGTFSMTIPGPDGSTVTETGKFVTIHEATEGGEWKIVVDTWNSDQMPGAAESGPATQTEAPAGQ